ncbi:MAG TPA: M20/M25/M40 family metallo-hydrolase [Actinomycetes bacterium]|nr:M20/M25/M40 family metallo-hydrolase [Actinomycetes bacterium]
MRHAAVRPIRTVTVGLGLALLVGCTEAGSDRPGAGPPAASTPTPTLSATLPSTPSSPASSSPASSPSATGPSATGAASARTDVDRVLATIRTLSERIGPREATSVAYRRAAELVEGRLRAFGFRVHRQAVRVPAGISWGVPVPAGRTRNVVAEPPGFDPARPHLIVGAHLDTVPQAPGAEDNASGVAVMLETARLAADTPPVVPVVFVAFAAEEPRGDGDDRHHYGSRAFVAGLDRAERRALLGMISLDRVGVGARVPVCTGGLGPETVAGRLARVARRMDIAVRRCADNRASDHWSFERAGLAAARIGSTPYPEYHSAADRISVVQRRQLSRVARLLNEALRTWPG